MHPETHSKRTLRQKPASSNFMFSTFCVIHALQSTLKEMLNVDFFSNERSNQELRTVAAVNLIYK